MRSYQQWKDARLLEDLGDSLIPPNIPRTHTGLVGNEVRTDSGRAARRISGESERRFDQALGKFKTRITELPVPRIEKPMKGLGDLGLDLIGKSTFASSESDLAWTKDKRNSSGSGS